MAPVCQVAHLTPWPQLVEGNDAVARDVSIFPCCHDDDQARVQRDGKVAQMRALIHDSHHKVNSFLLQR